jgi:glycosyltransferase involved in cell wall biosynthesis
MAKSIPDLYGKKLIIMRKGKRSICFLTAAYPSPTEPERACFVETLALSIIKSQYDLFVVAPKIYTKDPVQESRKGIAISRFSFFSNNQLLMHQTKTPLIKMSIYMISGFFKTLSQCIRNKVDIIHANWILPTGMIGAMVSIILRKPLIIMARGADVNILPFKNKLFFWMTKFVLNKAKKIISVSAQGKAKMIKDFGITKSKISIVSSGVDFHLFNKQNMNQCRKKLDLDKKGIIAIFIGDLIARKGVTHMISAVQLLKSKIKKTFKLYIIGHGPLKQELENQVQKSGLKDLIIFKGKQTRSKIPIWINASDFTILPSLNEGTPNAVMESISCEKPVLASSVDGIKTLITDKKNGLLFKPGNPKDIVVKIEKYIQDPSIKNRILKYMAKGIEKKIVDVNTKSAEIIKIYEKL